MDCNLLYVPQFIYIQYIYFTFYLVLSNLLFLFGLIVVFFSFWAVFFGFLASGSPSWAFSLECNNDNNWYTWAEDFLMQVDASFAALQKCLSLR